ncbi:MAG: NAD-dependent protein deacylase [Lachnospiraceae bacterium]|nr:NAD-dependent protein deacylase [Lachnospiraceae bacterium]
MAYEALTKILRESKRIVFFGGAGVSTASGIPDFRSAQGLYQEKYRRTLSPEEMVSHSFFVRDPEDFFAFYKEKLVYPDAKPNACHYALAKLEAMGRLSAVVTQNIDGLHQAAGSRRVYELHGSVLRNYCTRCHAFYGADYILQAEGVPCCSRCGAIVKPDVVLYEEGLDDEVIEGAVRAIQKADTLIIGGTSLVVYPAAGLIYYFHGKHLVLINKSETEADGMAELVYHEDIAAVLGQAVAAMEAEEGAGSN